MPFSDALWFSQENFTSFFGQMQANGQVTSFVYQIHRSNLQNVHSIISQVVTIVKFSGQLNTEKQFIIQLIAIPKGVQPKLHFCLWLQLWSNFKVLKTLKIEN